MFAAVDDHLSVAQIFVSFDKFKSIIRNVDVFLMWSLSFIVVYHVLYVVFSFCMTAAIHCNVSVTKYITNKNVFHWTREVIIIKITGEDNLF